MQIRRCEDADRLLSQEAFRVYSACMYRPAYEENIRRMSAFLSDQQVRVFVCESQGEIAGILVLGCSGEVPEIKGIAVSADQRRRGIGRAMVRTAMETERLQRLCAQTDRDAAGFYRRCGFVCEETVREYPDGVSVRYQCYLSRPEARCMNGG